MIKFLTTALVGLGVSASSAAFAGEKTIYARGTGTCNARPARSRLSRASKRCRASPRLSFPMRTRQR